MAATTLSASRMARSPTSDVLESSQDMVEMAGLFNMKSPLTILANDLNANLFVMTGKRVKTPRRCLLQDLETASFEQPSPTLRHSRSLFEDKDKPPSSPSSPMDSPTRVPMNSLLPILDTLDPPDSERESKWPPSRLQRSATSVNLSKSEPFKRPVVSHWNQRRPIPGHHKTLSTSFPKKRELEATARSLPVYTPMEVDAVITKECRSNDTHDAHVHPPKMRRAMTVVGPALIHSSLKEPSLPSSMESGKDMIRRLSSPTLVQLMDGKFADKIDRFYIIDCRYPFEYQGGHIAGATNVNEVETLHDMFFKTPTTERVAVIFHCEYSIKRAPQMALHFRGTDRNLNQLNYPHLFYPELYILRDGYRDFFGAFKDRCLGGYVEMTHHDFNAELKAGIIHNKRQFKGI